jgi:hypothetical protein
LSKQGWKASSSYPDCCWRLAKDLGTEAEPKMVTVPFLNVDEALHLEAEYLDKKERGVL